MTAHSIKVLTCDRCGNVEEIRRVEQGYSWAELNYSETNGHRRIGTRRSDKALWIDLCPSCSADIYEWFKKPAKETSG